jgi:hypothetical protein
MLRFLNDADRNEVMVENKDIEEFLAAYRQGATADFIQPWQDGRWGALWAFPPCDPAAAERAGRQMARMGATKIRWIRRAQLRDTRGTTATVILTEFPTRHQRVIAIYSGALLEIGFHLEDAMSNSLTDAFGRRIHVDTH